MIHGVAAKARIVGAAFVEYVPEKDPSGSGTQAIARLASNFIAAVGGPGGRAAVRRGGRPCSAGPGEVAGESVVVDGVLVVLDRKKFGNGERRVDEYGTWRSSISRSTESCGAATWRASKSRMSHHMGMQSTEP